MSRYFRLRSQMYSVRVARRDSRCMHVCARARGTDLARSLIAINHCQNSATRRTTRAAGYHQQSRVLRDQRDKGRHGEGRVAGTGRDVEPVRYFRKLGPTALAFSADPPRLRQEHLRARLGTRRAASETREKGIDAKSVRICSNLKRPRDQRGARLRMR